MHSISLNRKANERYVIIYPILGGDELFLKLDRFTGVSCGNIARNLRIKGGKLIIIKEIRKSKSVYKRTTSDMSLS